MKVSITDYEDYLYDHYKNHGMDTSLFMKLVEEVGEVAEVLNKRDGRKASNSEDLKSQLANELVDVIHYTYLKSISIIWHILDLSTIRNSALANNP